MVRHDVTARKIARAGSRLEAAEGIFSRPWEELAGDAQALDLGTFYLFLAIQECIDLGAHWVSDAGWRLPDEAAGAFDVLAAHGVLDFQLADEMRAATGLRNRIAHGYAEIDHVRIYSEFQQGVASLRRFLSAVAAEAGL